MTKMKIAAFYTESSDDFLIGLGRPHIDVVTRVLTPDQADRLLFELQHAIWARQQIKGMTT